MKSAIRALPGALALLLALAVPSGAVLCTIDEVPAATVLFPYVVADIGACGSSTGRNTRLTIVNAAAEATLAHVTLWTDWAVPVMAFDVYLTGYDLEILDFRRMLCDGDLPATGSAVSPHGELSDPPFLFPSCNNGTAVGSDPNWGPGAISSLFRAHLKAYLTGAASPLSGSCAGSGSEGPTMARGFVTVDVVHDCNALFPSDSGYFSAALGGFENVLIGSYSWNAANGSSFASLPAVHLEAAPPGFFSAGDHTFYGRYLGGSAVDRREPMPSQWAASFHEAGPFQETELVVWRETNHSVSPISCALPGPASWFPLPAGATVFDQQETAVESSPSLPIAVNRFALTADAANPFTVGWTALDLTHAAVAPIYGDTRAQAWAVVVGRRGGVERAAWNAVALAPLCSAAAP